MPSHFLHFNYLGFYYDCNYRATDISRHDRSPEYETRLLVTVVLNKCISKFM